MDQLVQLVQQKAGLSEEQARSAVTTVIGFLKERLPAPVAAQVDSLLGSDTSGVMGQASGLLGGLMGGDKK